MLSKGKKPLDKEKLETLRVELQSVLDGLMQLTRDEISAFMPAITDINEIRLVLDDLEAKLNDNETSSRKLLDKLHAISGADKLAQKIDDFEFKAAREELAKFKEELDKND